MSDCMRPTQAALYRRIARNLLPLLVISYIIAYIDRQNVSFAKLEMVHDLGLSEAAFGLGASLFFIGYLIFEIPSNLILVRVGPRRWLARIMISWGIITILLAFTPNATVFYLLRFFLGVAEAGFYPGILYLLTLWFPASYRGRMISYFVIGSVAANLISGPINGLLLGASGLFDLRGWQWIFLVTGLPAVFVAVLLLRYLPDSPQEASFLSEAERHQLLKELESERLAMPATHKSPMGALTDPRVLSLTALFTLFTLSAYGFSYWLPTVIKSFGVSDKANGLLNVIPWIFVAFVLFWIPRKPGRVDNTFTNIVIPSVIGAAAFVASYFLPWPPLQFAALCAAVVCIFVAQPCFWTLPGRFLSGASAAAAIAAINSVGNMGGFLGQTLVPLIGDATGSTAAPLLFLATGLLMRGIMTMILVRKILRLS